MKLVKLTEEQAITLSVYLLLSTSYRKEEFECCKRLSEEKNEDGTIKFKNMKSIAEWWKKAINTIEDIKNALDNAKHED